MQTNTVVFNDVLNQVLESMTDPLRENHPQSLVDPRFCQLLSAKAIVLQSALAEKLNSQSDENPQDIAVSSRLLRTLVLMDRAHSRIARATPKAPAADAGQLTIQREEAHNFLQTELSFGPRPATDLLAAARKLGIAKRTLLRAKSDLSITSHIAHREDRSHCWMWKYTATTSSPINTAASAPLAKA